jgi:hypothetical protein
MCPPDNVSARDVRTEDVHTEDVHTGRAGTGGDRSGSGWAPMSHAVPDPLDGVERAADVLDSLHGWTTAERPSPDTSADGSSTSTPEERVVADLARENENLRVAIDSRAVIEQAKGALMLRYGLDQDAAFAVLKRWSQDSNIKLHTIADTLINSVCRDDPPPPDNPDLAHWLEESVRVLPGQDGTGAREG